MPDFGYTEESLGGSFSRMNTPSLKHLPAAMRKQTGNTTATVLCAAGTVGLVALGNHGTQFDVHQATYATEEECQRDWDDESACQPSSNQHGSYYVGPRYYWDPQRNHPVIIGGDGSERVATHSTISAGGSLFGRTSIVGSFARGGFGRIGRGFSSGRGG